MRQLHFNQDLIARAYLYAILGTLFILPFLFDDRMMRGFHSPKNLFLQLSVFLILLIQLLKQKTRFQFNILDTFILLRFVFILIMVIITAGVNEILHRIDILFYLVLFYFLVQLAISSTGQVTIIRLFRKTVTLLSLAGALISIYGLLQYFDLDIFHPEGYSYYESKVIGTFSNPNPMGGFLAVVFPFCVYGLFHSASKDQKALYLLGAFIIIWALVLTLSRGAWVALAGGMLVFGYPTLVKLWRSRFRKRVYKAGALVLLGLSGALLIWSSFRLNPASALGRIFEWRVAWEMVADHPVRGVGYGRFGAEYLNYQAEFFEDPSHATYFDNASNSKRAHSEYVQVVAETGILGLGLFLALLWAFFRVTRNVLKAGSMDSNESWAIRTLLAAVSIILIHSLVDNPLHIQPISLMFYFTLGLMSLYAKQVGEADGAVAASGSRRPLVVTFSNHWMLVVASIILLAYNVIDVAKKGSGYIHWQNGQDLVHNGNWHNGIDEYQQALALLPHEGELMFHLGSAYAYTGRVEQALPLLESSRAGFNDKNIYIVKGSALLQLARYDKAEESFTTAIRMVPKLLLPRLWLAEMYLKIGRGEEAIERLREIISIEPKVMTGEARGIKRDAQRLLEIHNLE